MKNLRLVKILSITAALLMIASIFLPWFVAINDVEYMFSVAIYGFDRLSISPVVFLFGIGCLVFSFVKIKLPIAHILGISNLIIGILLFLKIIGLAEYDAVNKASNGMLNAKDMIEPTLGIYLLIVASLAYVLLVFKVKLPTMSKINTNSALIEELDKLNDLRLKGALTDEEFNTQKAKVLNN